MKRAMPIICHTEGLLFMASSAGGIPLGHLAI